MTPSWYPRELCPGSCALTFPHGKHTHVGRCLQEAQCACFLTLSCNPACLYLACHAGPHTSTASQQQEQASTSRSVGTCSVFPSLSTAGSCCCARPHGSDVVTTPLLLCSPLVPGWLAHHTHTCWHPRPTAFFTPLHQQKQAPSPGRKQAQAQPGSHSPKMPANPGVEREREASTGGSERPGVSSACLA